jgi:hypothetical protein
MSTPTDPAVLRARRQELRGQIARIRRRLDGRLRASSELPLAALADRTKRTSFWSAAAVAAGMTGWLLATHRGRQSLAGTVPRLVADAITAYFNARQPAPPKPDETT